MTNVEGVVRLTVGLHAGLERWEEGRGRIRPHSINLYSVVRSPSLDPGFYEHPDGQRKRHASDKSTLHCWIPTGMPVSFDVFPGRGIEALYDDLVAPTKTSSQWRHGTLPDS